MPHRVWIGDSTATASQDWRRFASIEEFVASGESADQVVVNDPAAVLREADWLKLYTAVPLAQILRRVGPWRAGIERTDPQWPAGTTVVTQSIDDLIYRLDEVGLPPTAAYEDRAALAYDKFDLSGERVLLRIADPSLRACWEETLRECSADLADDSLIEAVDLEITDREPVTTATWIIRLMPDPWNVTPSRNHLAASVLDSPWEVLSAYVQSRGAVR